MFIETQYFPPVDFFVEAKNHSQIVIDDKERYSKQSYRNRTQILTSNGVLDLTVPVGSKRIPVQKLRIDNNQTWVNDHLRAIQSAYGRSPFFEHFYDFICSAFEPAPTSLLDFNRKSLTICLKLLQIDIPVKFLSEIDKTDEELLQKDFRNHFHPKIKREQNPKNQYTQLFGKEFVPNLSVLDLLFCEGRL